MWRSNFETGDFSEWTWWRRRDGGTFFVRPPEVETAAAGGSKVAHFEVTPAQLAAGRRHSKVFKEWALAPPESMWRDDRGAPLERLPENSPAGSYVARYFLPPGYRKPKGQPWTNVFQFKESYLDGKGRWHQDPQWWINMSSASTWRAKGVRTPCGASSDAPVLHANHWNQEFSRYRPKLVAAPVGRWFEIRADLYPGNRIDWYLDGRLFDRSPATTYPVGLSKPRPVGWVFGIGHYGGIGRLLADDASFAAP